MGIIWFLVIGLIAGAIGRLLVPGRDPMGILGTMILGIIGSFVGGLLGSIINGGGFELSPSGIIGSIIGAVIALLAYRAMRSRGIA